MSYRLTKSPSHEIKRKAIKCIRYVSGSFSKCLLKTEETSLVPFVHSFKHIYGLILLCVLRTLLRHFKVFIVHLDAISNRKEK